MNHLSALEEQLTRTPSEFPTLKIRESLTDLDKVTIDDFVIENYKPQATIRMAMAV
jgi:thymidylate synthase